MDDPDINGFSDDESLAGLTQVPSQINLEKQHDEESDEFSDGGLNDLFREDDGVSRGNSVFGIIPAVNLANCSQNKTVNFDTEVFAIGMESQLSQDEEGQPDAKSADCNEIKASGHDGRTDKEIVPSAPTDNVHCSQVIIASFSGLLGGEI